MILDIKATPYNIISNQNRSASLPQGSPTFHRRNKFARDVFNSNKNQNPLPNYPTSEGIYKTSAKEYGQVNNRFLFFQAS